MTEFVVAVDFKGVIGTFYSIEKAKELLTPYSKVPIIFYSYPYDNEWPKGNIWVIPYLNDVVAFASNNKDLCDKNYTMLFKMNLTYETDSLDWWKCNIDEIIEFAADRLKIQLQVIELKGNPERMKEITESADKMVKKFIEDYKKYSDNIDSFDISDSIVVRLPQIQDNRPDETIPLTDQGKTTKPVSSEVTTEPEKREGNIPAQDEVTEKREGNIPAPDEITIVDG